VALRTAKGIESMTFQAIVVQTGDREIRQEISELRLCNDNDRVCFVAD
jgi:hypothetical protein